MSNDGSKVAVLMINTGAVAQDLSLSFSEIPNFKQGNSVHIRDIWARKDIGTFSGTFTFTKIASHDAAFIMISSAQPSFSATS